MKSNSSQFIDVFSDINNMFLQKINNAKNYANGMIETELFNDFIETYKRAYILIERNRILDGMVLVRNSFELLMMLCGIKINSEVKEEYIREDSYERYTERKKGSKKATDYLSQSFLRKIILKKYSNIEEDYTKIYNALSKYVHPTIHRNVLRYVEREKIDMRIPYLNIATLILMLFLEILNEEKFIPAEQFYDVSVFKYIIERITLIYLAKAEETKRLLGANKYLFTDENKMFYDKVQHQYRSELIKMEKELKQFNNEIKDTLIKVLSKIEYINISQKLSKLNLMWED